MKMAHRYNEQFNLTHRDRNMLRFLEKKNEIYLKLLDRGFTSFKGRINSFLKINFK